MKLKKASIFDEGQYRKDFYHMVIGVKPLFQNAQVTTSKELNPIQCDNEKNQITPDQKNEFKELATNVVAAKLQSKLEEMHPSNPSIESSAFSTAINLDPIFNFLQGVDNNELYSLNGQQGFHYSDFKEEFFDLALEVSELLQPKKEEEKWFQFYEIDSKACMNILFHETKLPLGQAVIFNFEKYESEKHGNRKKKPSLKSSNLTLEDVQKAFMQMYTDQFCKAAPVHQYDLKIKVLQKTQIIAGNILYDFGDKFLEGCRQAFNVTQADTAKNCLEQKPELESLRNEPKFKQINQFTEDKFTRYMSVSSITDYEMYISKFIKTAFNEKLYTDLEKVLSQQLQQLNKEGLILKDESKIQGIEVLLSAEYLYLRCKKMLISKIVSLRNLLLKENNSLNKRKITLALLGYGLCLKEFERNNLRLQNDISSWKKNLLFQNSLMEKLIKYQEQTQDSVSWILKLLEKHVITKDLVQEEMKSIQNASSPEESESIITKISAVITEIIQEIEKEEFVVIEKEISSEEEENSHNQKLDANFDVIIDEEEELKPNNFTTEK